MIRSTATDVVTTIMNLLIIAIIVFGLGLICWGSYSIFGPKNMAVQSSIFHNSQQYQDGMANRLEEYQEAYVGSNTQAQKDAIKSLVRHDFASYNSSNLSPDLQQFLQQMKGY